ncbi:MAG: hypothetical protein ABSH52_14760 [Terriglobia bacterium]
MLVFDELPEDIWVNLSDYLTGVHFNGCPTTCRRNTSFRTTCLPYRENCEEES